MKFLVAVGIYVLVMSMVVFVLIGRENSYRAHCAAAGGHIYQPSSIMFCLSDDSRFIEVYP